MTERRGVAQPRQAEECCGRLFPFSYSLDTTGWPPGDYTLMCLTDNAVGIAQGSDGPEIDTKTITVEQFGAGSIACPDAF